MNTTAEKIRILNETPLFNGLDSTSLELLAKQIVVKKLTRNEILFLAGEPATGMYVVASGAVRAFRTGSDGREQVIHVERAITTIAEVPVFDGGAYPSTVAADEPTTVYFLSRKSVLATASERPEIALAAVRLMASRLRRCAELVEVLSLREVGERLAALLFNEAKSHGTETTDGIRLNLRLTHHQLAARIGTVREVVTRTLIRLTEMGLIDQEGKNILVRDMKGLAIYAKSDPGL